jgi:hypothetical protein
MKYRFSGHQTFAFRYGWLEKGVRLASESPGAFLEEDAIVHLGVGRNMVESIRHWCLATQLLCELPARGASKGRTLQPTPIAKKLLSPRGWDPFLEDDGSLWLIHWLLVSNPDIGTSCQIVFGHLHKNDFSKRELIDFIDTFARKHSITARETSLVRDVDCLLRSYFALPQSSNKLVAEETFDCPLQELNLLHVSPDSDVFRFAIGPKASLPPHIVAYSVNEYFLRSKRDANTMSIQECLYGIECPGQVFKLDENSLLEYMDDIEDLTHGAIAIDDTAGLKQLYRRKQIDSFEILQAYYSNRRKGR